MNLKKVQKVGLWLILSLFLQGSALLYINNVFLSNNKPITGKIIDTFVQTDAVKKIGVNYKLPADAEQVKVSYDGVYVSFVSGKNLSIVDMAKKEVKKSFPLDKFDLAYYKWLPDRNRMIIVFKGSTANQVSLSVYAYEMGSDKEQHVKDIDGNLDYLPKDITVKDIQLSTLTNRIYLTTDINNHTENRIYKIDIMNEAYRVYPVVSKIGKLSLLNFQDTILYEDPTRNYIYKHNSSGNAQVAGNAKYALIGVDNEDIVYLGELNEGKVVRILSGSMDNDIKNWSRFELAQPALPADIMVSYNGKLYEKLDNIKTIYNIKTKEKFIYDGVFLELAEGYVVTLSGDSVKRVVFNK